MTINLDLKLEVDVAPAEATHKFEVVLAGGLVAYVDVQITVAHPKDVDANYKVCV